MVPPFAPSFTPSSLERKMGCAGMNPAPPQDAVTGHDERRVG